MPIQYMVFGFKPITFGTSPITTRPGLPPYVSYFVNFVFFVHSKFVVEFSVQKIIATTGYLDGAVKEKDSIFKSTSASSDLLLDLLALVLSLSLFRPFPLLSLIMFVVFPSHKVKQRLGFCCLTKSGQILN